VAIEEAAAQRLRELPADRSLSGAHRPDEIEVVRRVQASRPSIPPGAKTRKTRGPAQWPALEARLRSERSERATDQLIRAPSRRMRGVTKIRSSALSLTVNRLRNR